MVMVVSVVETNSKEMLWIPAASRGEEILRRKRIVPGNPMLLTDDQILIGSSYYDIVQHRRCLMLRRLTCQKKTMISDVIDYETYGISYDDIEDAVRYHEEDPSRESYRISPLIESKLRAQLDAVPEEFLHE
jgi:hypothetical protein